MAVRLIRCRNTDTGGEAEIPETGLQHLGAYEPIEAADRKRLGYDQASADQAAQAPAGGDQTDAGAPPADDNPKGKTATGGKTKKESRDGD